MLDEIAVLSKFEKFGYSRRSLITREQLSSLVRQLSRDCKASGVQEWPRELIDELSQECRLNSKGQLLVEDYVRVVVRAQ